MHISLVHHKCPSSNNINNNCTYKDRFSKFLGIESKFKTSITYKNQMMSLINIFYIVIIRVTFLMMFLT